MSAIVLSIPVSEAVLVTALGALTASSANERKDQLRGFPKQLRESLAKSSAHSVGPALIFSQALLNLIHARSIPTHPPAQSSAKTILSSQENPNGHNKNSEPPSKNDSLAMGVALALASSRIALEAFRWHLDRDGKSESKLQRGFYGKPVNIVCATSECKKNGETASAEVAKFRGSGSGSVPVISSTSAAPTPKPFSIIGDSNATKKRTASQSAAQDNGQDSRRGGSTTGNDLGLNRTSRYFSESEILQFGKSLLLGSLRGLNRDENAARVGLSYRSASTVLGRLYARLKAEDEDFSKSEGYGDSSVLQAIFAMLRHNYLDASEVRAVVSEQSSQFNLSPQLTLYEIQVLRDVAQGMSLKESTKRLDTNENSLSNARFKAYAKLGTSNSAARTFVALLAAKIFTLKELQPNYNESNQVPRYFAAQEAWSSNAREFMQRLSTLSENQAEVFVDLIRGMSAERSAERLSNLGSQRTRGFENSWDTRAIGRMRAHAMNKMGIDSGHSRYAATTARSLMRKYSEEIFGEPRYFIFLLDFARRPEGLGAEVPGERPAQIKGFRNRTDRY